MKTLTTYLIVFLIIINFGFTLAQTGKLKGIVEDSAGIFVETANVMIQDTKFITSTDHNGRYIFTDIPVGNYSIVLIVMGNKPIVKKIAIKENETTELNFNLNLKINQLKEISILGTISVNGMGHLTEVHDGIIYSGKKTEIIVLDSLDANTAQNNPREVLGRIPGSNYSETEGGGFPSNGIAFRGLRPTQSMEVQTRQNGYNIAADLYGYPESYYVPPLEAVDRIEVIRGASSLQFGPQFGGVINYITRNGPPNKPIEFTTSQTGGSYGLFSSYNSLGGTYKKWSYFSYIQYKNIEGQRPNSDVKQTTGFAKIQYQATEKLKLGFEYSILRNTIHMPGGLTDEQFDKDPTQSLRSRNWLRSPWNILAFTADYKISSRTQLVFKSSFNYSSRDLVWKNEDGGPEVADSISPITNSYVQREVQREAFLSSTNELRALINYNIVGVNQTLAVGVRYFSGRMKRQGGGPGSEGSDFDLKLYGGKYEYDLDFTTTNLAPFFENTFHIGKRFSITPGFRYEYIHSTSVGYITDDNTSANVHTDLSKSWYLPLAGLGIQIKTSKTIDVYANISEAYEPTNYSNLTPIGVASVIDPNMKDVSGYNADFGFRGELKRFLNFDIGLFYMAFNKEIGLVTLNDLNGNPYTYRTNVGNSVHKGLETYIEVNPFKLLNVKSRIGNISFFNSYAYVDAKYIEGPFKGKNEEMAPKNIDRLGIIYSYKKISTTFAISTVSESYSDANNTIISSDAMVGEIPANQIVDWSGTIRIKNYAIKMGINNLTDIKYFTLRTDEYPGPGIIPASGRTFYLGFKARF
ncbi:MAG: TonB-dependent receptor [Bacteroidetes bacterium]|nr:TonB-dependent receptor [Bacteroidota bacterium]